MPPGGSTVRNAARHPGKRWAEAQNRRGGGGANVNLDTGAETTVSGVGRRRPTVTVDVGGVPVGSGHPVVVQSMTNTDTADVEARSRRWRCSPRRAASWCGYGKQRRGRQAVPRIVERLDEWAAPFPSSGTSTTTATSCSPSIPNARGPWPSTASTRETWAASARRKFPHHHRDGAANGTNPSASASTGDRWISSCSPSMMDENARRPEPARRARRHPAAMVESALRSAALAEEVGLPARPDHPQREGVGVQDLIDGKPDAGRPLRLPPPSRASPKRAWA